VVGEYRDPRPTDQPDATVVCRSCRAPLHDPLLDLGEQPLGDSLLQEGDLTTPEPTYPLAVTVCMSCWLLQLAAFDAAPGVPDSHGHGSMYSTTTSRHERRWAEVMMAQLGIDHRGSVVEIGSGDGSLLRHFANRGARVLGIEASPAAVTAAREGGVPTVCTAFDLRAAQRLAQDGWSADLVIANHTLPHVDDVDEFLAGVRVLLAPDGRFSTELVHVQQMIEQAQFDLVCHSHRCYLSLTALLPSLARHQLAIVHAEEVAVHGGSLRVLASHASRSAVPDGTADALLQREEAKGLKRVQTYGRLGQRAIQVRTELLGFLREANWRGRSVVAYGAPTRGSTLLNYCGITPELVAFTVDRSPRKQGRYLPGSRLPVLPPERLDEARPDYVLILPWTLGDEIMEQLRGLGAWGGRFILPLPTLRVVN
jgi:2-polyprenyl-3-methyl-5-hydroxy-6-metoxy-1,4-benzoquinol methylase